jgi:hypothetical protein
MTATTGQMWSTVERGVATALREFHVSNYGSARMELPVRNQKAGELQNAVCAHPFPDSRELEIPAELDQIETEKIYFGLMSGGSFGSQSTDTGVSESWPNLCAAGPQFVGLSVQKVCQTETLIMGETPKVCGGFADKSRRQ